MAFELKRLTKNCNTIDDFVSLSFDFSFGGQTIKPHQNKMEVSILLHFLKSIDPCTVLEIGTSEGGTLFLLSQILSKNAKIISVDLPKGAGGGELYPDWKKSLYKSFISENQQIFLLRENSHALTTFEKIQNIIQTQKIDFLFIDGDHSYEGVKKDFELYFPLVAENGIIAFHDINEVLWNKIGVQRFWKKIKSKYPTFEIIDKSKNDGLGIGLLIKSKNIPGQNYIELLKRILMMKDKKLQKLNNNPISAILSIYYDRKDLQEVFPEVEKNDYNRIIKWALNICDSNDPKKMEIKYRLIKHHAWYKIFLQLYQNKN